MADLTTIENKLILPENEVVAVVHPDIARVIYDNRTYKGPIGKYIVGDKDLPKLMDADKSEGPDYEDKRVKVGSTFFGLYGSIGEIDLFEPYTGIVALVGTVHIPKQIFPLVELFNGEEGLNNFYKEFFTQTEGNEWKGKQWNIRVKESVIDVEKVGNIPFVSKQGYNWKVEKVRNDIFKDGRVLENQVSEYELAVKDFIHRLDNYIHKINPTTADQRITHETAKTHYDKLQRGEVKLIGQ